MSTNRPTASVTGQEGWEWNRWQSNQQSTTRSSPRQQTPNSSELRREVRNLQTALAQKDRRMQSIIERYERLLTEKNQQLETDSQPNSPADDRRLSALLEWVDEQFLPSQP